MTTRIVRKDSWHCRLYTFTLPDEEQQSWQSTSVCNYWGQILSVPFMLLLFVVLLAGVGPLVWISNKVEKWAQGKQLCPFGTIERRDEETLNSPITGSPDHPFTRSGGAA